MVTGWKTRDGSFDTTSTLCAPLRTMVSGSLVGSSTTRQISKTRPRALVGYFHTDVDMRNPAATTREPEINVEIVWYDLVNNKDIIKKNVSEWATYSLGIDIGVDGLDNDLDGLVDSEDEDEYGTPREGAIRIALEKISKRIINELTSTW